MSRTIIIDPITRMSGFLEIRAEVGQNTVLDAKTSGLLFRGFEKMLKGRAPLDAIYFTERICGICSTAHAVAAALALEEALNITVGLNDLYIRDLMHGFEFVQNHLRQFYLFTVPGFVKMPEVSPLSPQYPADFRIPEELSNKIAENYAGGVEFSRMAHEGLAVLGGKAPHTHGIFAGGVTVSLDAYKLEKVKFIVNKIKEFVNNNMLEDIDIISKYYNDYFQKGISYPNFMSYGLFNKYFDSEISYVKPGVEISGRRYRFDVNKITENIKHSWYHGNSSEETPGIDEGEEVNINKPEAYTFVKAPRYDGLPMETGPLARLILSGEYTRGHSCMDRNTARVLETKKILDIMERLIELIKIAPNKQAVYEIPEKAFGTGLTDTTRGALGHWVEIDNKLIKHYDIITPTAWNLSPMDSKGLHGVGEKALIGTRISNIEDPVELGRIIRSFDPCVSCATHVLVNGDYEKEFMVI